MTLHLCSLAVLTALAANDDLPDITVQADDITIAKSCRIVIPPGTVIEDKNGNGVIQITASNIVVDFADGSVLRGAKEGVRPDEYEGYGICLNGQTGVTLRKARVRGYRCGAYATKADGFTLEDADASDARRTCLRSTPVAEDTVDWLSPHNNDKKEWLSTYGSAIYIEDSAGVTVRRCRVRDSQNGLCLDRVKDSKIYDNDFSFLSGWGIALWRSSHNVISRNAVDFCIRGYSHGVYNRGQDSAGFLVFEQCSENVFAENSATHGGDGFFGFAGLEATGEAPAPTANFDYKRRGCNDNLLLNNDCSYAAAHGIELTFSFGNRFIGNRLVGNAICGVWGGYSQDTLIADNTIEQNGEAGYSLERGGVNIEHGRKNHIVHNRFAKNKCAVHLWWDEDAAIAKSPWAKANGVESTDTLIADNTFSHDDMAFQFRGRGDAMIGANKLTLIRTEIEADPNYLVNRNSDLHADPPAKPEATLFGETRPVGARKNLQGRENIIMTEWGPWDHQTPLVRLVETAAGEHTYDMHNLPEGFRVTLLGSGVSGQTTPGKPGAAPRYVVSARSAGVHPYTMNIAADKYRNTIKGTLVGAKWDVTFFNWSKDTDPREKLDAWRALAQSPGAVALKSDRLTYRFGGGGPGELRLAPELAKSSIGRDYFGLVARTTLLLSKGTWKFATLSDDGVRVSVNGKTIIDDWNWHPPKRDEATYDMPAHGNAEIVVEYFEIDGYAVLEFDITAAGSEEESKD